jgi:ribosomal protein S18 acetylase RimI-like enzyme
MPDHATGVADPVETGREPVLPGDRVLPDAGLLKEAVRESILTSPGSFLKTVYDVDHLGAYYWNKEIDRATWVVIQQSGEVVGIAVARWPDQTIDHDIDQLKARFIESVWIAPKFRGSRMGERLVKYLIEVECEKQPSVRQFMLWVFKDNERAISLYERMKFTYVKEHALENGRVELLYEYVLPDVPDEQSAVARRENQRARQRDLRQYGVTYRVLRKDYA